MGLMAPPSGLARTPLVMLRTTGRVKPLRITFSVKATRLSGASISPAFYRYIKTIRVTTKPLRAKSEHKLRLQNEINTKEN